MPARFEMRLEYEKCRTWGHAWSDFIPADKRQPGWGRRFSLRCDRCATERHDVIDTLGELSTRQYVYPDDYQMARDERPTMQQLRLDLLRQLRANGKERVARQRRRVS